MSIRRCRLIIGLMTAALLVLTSASSASAVGYWNLPGTYCQYYGYGNGPGYHVPMVLGPVACDGFFGMGVRRLPCPPTAMPAGCVNCIASPTSSLFQTTVLP